MRLLSTRKFPVIYLCSYLSSSLPPPSSSLTTTTSFAKTLHQSSRHLATFQSQSQSLSMSTSSSSNAGLTDIGKSSNRNNNSHNGNKETTNTISSWREKIEISIAKSRKVRGGNYVQIATVDPKTFEPRCRTVVFRGFLKPDTSGNDSKTKKEALPCIMKMITDKRSNKYQEVTDGDDDNDDDNNNGTTSRGSNSVEMVWWFSKSSEQYRIRGQLKFVGGDETDAYLLSARKQQWGNLSDMAREQFYWVDPGLSHNDAELTSHEIPTGGRDEDGKVLPPPENFLLMLLYPKRCDYLRLGDNFRQVDDLVERKDEEEEWDTNRVNP